MASGSQYSYSIPPGITEIKIINLIKSTRTDIKFGFDNGTVPGSRYVLIFADGRKEYFDNNGNIRAIKDRFNNTISFTISNLGMTITDTYGRTVTTSHANNITTMFLPDGTKHEFGRTGSWESLAYKKDPLNQQTNYTYNFTNLNASACSNMANSSNVDKTTVSVLYRQLNTVSYPTGAKQTFEYTTKNGKILEGSYDYPVISKTYTQNINQTQQTDVHTYGYSHQHFTNPPAYYYPYQLSTYTTTVTDPSGLVCVKTFNHKH
jgi:hypothetical protein